MEKITGFHPIRELLKKKGITGTLFVAGRKNEKVRSLRECAENRGLSVNQVSLKELDTIAGGLDHRGVLLMYDIKVQTEKTNLSRVLNDLDRRNACVLLLDGISDPHNLGAILRSADQFYIDLVVIPSRRTAPVSQVAVSSSAGAAHHVPLAHVTNLSRAAEACKQAGFWVYGADIQGESIERVDFTGRTALVLGSEGRGLSRLVREHCDGMVRIPSRGHVDSFNVSVAAGIILYELRRQQHFE